VSVAVYGSGSGYRINYKTTNPDFESSTV